jgi:beta-lactamase regulating signal transducer with metallopeptidase domain
MTLLAYLLKVIVVSAIMYGYYRLFLRNKRFHHYNRFFLLSALLLSIVLPFIRIPLLYQPENPVNDAVYRTVSVINTDYDADLTAAPLNESIFTLMNSIYLVYAAGVLFLLTLVIKSLIYIRTLRKRYPAEKITSLRFYNTHEPGTPFSFFRSIFWNDQLAFNSSEGQQIFRHEFFHVQHQHSVDRLLAELLTAIFWFNPFFHLIKKELKAIHEFLADQFAISESDRYAYATLLVQQALESGKHAVTNHFFQNHIKRRIAMITQFKQSKYGYWSRVMILPVSLLLFCFISLYAKKPAPGIEKKLASVVFEQPLTLTAEAADEGTGATTFNTGGAAKANDTIPAKNAREKELQKIRTR